jgi:hypothetical protein
VRAITALDRAVAIFTDTVPPGLESLMHDGPRIRRIPAEALDAPTRGWNLVPGSLADQLGEARTLLVFLRQLGSSAGLTVEELRDTSADDAEFPPILFFHSSERRRGARFFEERWPGARAVADPERLFHRAFGLRRSGLGSLFGADAWVAGLRALSRGAVPGLFVVENGSVLWCNQPSGPGERPDFADLPLIAASLS